MAAPIDAGEIEWLRADALYATATSGAVAAAWGADARSTVIISSYAERAAAIAEADRQLAWLKGPLVQDVHTVSGQRADLYLQWVELQIPRLGYDAGVACFVTDVVEADDAATTRLTVLRPL